MNAIAKRKPKTPQKKNVNEVSGRDLFQTPNYATDIIIPFLQDMKFRCIWECAAGLGKIVKRLSHFGFGVYGSDLDSEEYPKHNFLTQNNEQYFDCVVTNTPFSLKQEFLLRCLEYEKPFALLVPAEYAIWVIDAVDKHGCEKIIPRRRIDYITPNTLHRIWEGEAWRQWGATTCTLEEWKESHTPQELQNMLDTAMEFKFDSIYDAPAKLLRKYSSSYYHSMWLTRGFNIGKTETFVELTNEMKDNI